MDLFEYESQKRKKKRLKCDKCGHTWMLDTIHTQVIKNENGQEMNIQFFLCPKCNEIYIVSIIDFKIRVLLERIGKLDKKILRMKKQGKVDNEAVSKRNQLKQSAMFYEKALKNKYAKYFYLRTEEVNH